MGHFYSPCFNCLKMAELYQVLKRVLQNHNKHKKG